MLCRMMRIWILGGVAFVVALVALSWAITAHFGAVNGDASHPPKLFHQAYTGIEFRYPATWHDVKGAHGIADFQGARGCEIAVRGNAIPTTTVAVDLESLRQDYAHNEPDLTFGARPAWAGAQQPDGSFATAKDKGKGVREIAWETGFEHQSAHTDVTETMQEGDAACLSDLLNFERTFRLFPADTTAP